jgi:hypothetical protein
VFDVARPIVGKAIVCLPFFLSIFHRYDRAGERASERASERTIEFREINLDVAEIRRGPVEWKIGLRHRVWLMPTFLAFNIQ